MARTATVGQLLINAELPEELRDYERVLDSKGVAALFKSLATSHPDKYRDISFRLMQIAKQSAHETGGMSIRLSDLQTTPVAKRHREILNKKLADILRNPKLSREEREKQIVQAAADRIQVNRKELLEEALANKNPLADMITSGARGSAGNLASLVGSDLLYADQAERPIPVPVLRNYAEGLSPAEYWAGAYGVRKGLIGTKLCLAAGTQVRMADLTTKAIEDIRVGDLVLGSDWWGRLVATEVTNTFNNGTRPCSSFVFSDGTVKVSVVATADHQILTPDLEHPEQPLRQAKQALHVEIGGQTKPFSHTDYHYRLGDWELLREDDRGERPTYDIEVAHPSHLFVLANGLIVSNSVAQAGYVLKQMAQTMHRLVVAEPDYEDEEQQAILRGMPADVDDTDNDGALLARKTGPYEKNTVITPKIRRHLQQLGEKRILVRSPITGGTADGAVYGRDVGVREANHVAGPGEQVGIQAAQALGEPLSQSSLGSKHGGGVVGTGRTLSGFQAVSQLLQAPKVFNGGATHTEVDGQVESIQPAEAGGHYVKVSGKSYFVPNGVPVTVKVGDQVEAGDTLSEGLPNPSVVVAHKGIGEGRRFFVQEFMKAMKGADMNPSRRNAELLARGLLNHVKLSKEIGDYVPDDVVPYSAIEHSLPEREDAEDTKISASLGRYLERPVLHYSIGTRIRPSVVKTLKEFGVDRIRTHREPPPFEPLMVRAAASLQHDEDPIVQMYGSGLKKSLLTSTHLGKASDPGGSSFVSGLATASNFGDYGRIKKPEAGEAFNPETGQLLTPKPVGPKSVSPVNAPKTVPDTSVAAADPLDEFDDYDDDGPIPVSTGAASNFGWRKAASAPTLDWFVS